MPLLETKGAGSAQGYGEFTASAPKVYIEDCFSCFLYTGNSSTQTITNNIDLSTKGGLVWIKGRSANIYHALFDTARGANKVLWSNDTSAQWTGYTDQLTSFNSNGFSLGADATGGEVNKTSYGNYVSWTFRKQPKFFDVVTWTGDGTIQNRAISHNLGSTPGCIIVKRTDQADDWFVWHRSANTAWTGGTISGDVTGGNQTGALFLDLTSAFNSAYGAFTYVNSTAFGVYYNSLSLNRNGATYVAYIFAHDAGGFGLSGTDNVISCGSFTTNGSGNVSAVTLGYEPQWVLYKTTDVADNWRIVDNMRGMPITAPTGEPVLKPNLADAEQADAGVVVPNATGFSINGASPSYTYIYIAIRRGPMKVPTSGTSVFSPSAASTANSIVTTDFPVDLLISGVRGGDATYQTAFVDRLRGIPNVNNSATPPILVSSKANAEANGTGGGFFTQRWTNTGYQVGFWGSDVFWAFRRAPGFFDVVCYTGTGAILSVNHNLGVAPELIIVKRRSGADGWYVGTAFTPSNYIDVQLQSSNNGNTNSYPNEFNSQPTASAFTVFNFGNLSGSGATYVAYLFATAAGVSKVGSYTGTGTTKQIDCGFTGGARFILIKRIDSTGDWYVYDTARGIVAGNDSYLFLNSTAAEVTNTDYVDTYSAGFELSSTAPAGLNANGGTFVFFAVA